jgi:hypothetical protein
MGPGAATVRATEQAVEVLFDFTHGQVHGRRITKDKEGFVASAQLTSEQPTKQLIAKLDRRRFVTVNTARDDLGAMTCVQRINQQNAGVPYLDAIAVRQGKGEGLKLPLMGSAQGQKIVMGNHAYLTQHQ